MSLPWEGVEFIFSQQARFYQNTNSNDNIYNSNNNKTFGQQEKVSNGLYCFVFCDLFVTCPFGCVSNLHIKTFNICYGPESDQL